MSRHHWYPEWVYNINEDITRRNMAEYDRRMDNIFDTCRELYPDYDRLPMQEQFKIYCEVCDIIDKKGV